MAAKLRIAGLAKNSIVDGPGIRYAIFTQGCHHKCEGCHNPQSHDPKEGSFADIDEIMEEIASTTLYEGVTFSGGEPFLQADTLADLAIKIKSSGLGLSIICYTGYTYEEIQDIISSGAFSYSRLLNNVDYLIDGRYESNKASLDCKWRGSTNQRIIDVNESRQQNKVIEIEL